jgi:hypothetical protein
MKLPCFVFSLKGYLTLSHPRRGSAQITIIFFAIITTCFVSPVCRHHQQRLASLLLCNAENAISDYLLTPSVSNTIGRISAIVRELVSLRVVYLLVFRIQPIDISLEWPECLQTIQTSEGIVVIGTTASHIILFEADGVFEATSIPFNLTYFPLSLGIFGACSRST